VDCMHLQIYTRALAAACARCVSQDLVVVVAPIEGQSRAVVSFAAEPMVAPSKRFASTLFVSIYVPSCCSSDDAVDDQVPSQVP